MATTTPNMDNVNKSMKGIYKLLKTNIKSNCPNDTIKKNAMSARKVTLQIYSYNHFVIFISIVFFYVHIFILIHHPVPVIATK